MYIPMIDAALELQPTITKTADFSGDWLDLGKRYAPGGLGEPVGAVIDVSALDLTDTDETYAFHLEQTDADENGDADTAAAEAIGVPVAVEATGIAVAKGLITKRFVRLVLDVDGETPSISYQAHLGK